MEEYEMYYMAIARTFVKPSQVVICILMHGIYSFQISPYNFLQSISSYI